MKIVARGELFGERCERIIARIGEFAQDWPVRNASDRKPRAVLRRDCRARHDGEIAVAARELAEGKAFLEAAPKCPVEVV